MAPPEETGYYFYQNDPNGMPVRLRDEQGEIVWQAHYTVLGQTDRLDEFKVRQPLRLQGQYFDEESGLYYNRHRYYDPWTGIFISQDPIGLLGADNSYQYAPNILRWVDPLGLSPSSTLDQALGGNKGDQLSAHHVIPVDVWNRNQGFFNDIGMGGARDTAPNGIHIPGSQSAYKNGLGNGIGVFHSSKHDNYSNSVEARVDVIKDQYYNGMLTKKDVKVQIWKLQNEMKNKIWNGDVSKTDCGRMN